MRTKKPKPRKEKSAETLKLDAVKRRKELESKVYRRKDGTLQCPTVYAEGFEKL